MFQNEYQTEVTILNSFTIEESRNSIALLRLA